MQVQAKDYLGVVALEQADFYLQNCPDPNWILGRDDIQFTIFRGLVIQHAANWIVIFRTANKSQTFH